MIRSSLHNLRRFATAVAAASLAAVAPAAACSVTSDYVRPSNFELVQIADAVVIATALEEIRSKDDTSVRFRIDSALKGAAPKEFTSEGTRIASVGPSSSSDLSQAHPEAYAGPCTRMTFRRGGRYLLFLEKAKDGSWGDVGFPFARTNEDYLGEDDEWIRAIRRYAALQQQLAPMEQLEALRKMVQTGREPGGAALSRVALADISAHLALLSPWKPTPYLVEAHRLLALGRIPEFGLRSPVVSEGGEAEALADFVTGRVRREGDPSIEEMRLFVLKALVEGDHPAAGPLFEAVLASPAPDVDSLGLALRFVAEHGQYPRAFNWIETKLMALLPRLSRGEAGRLIDAAITIQNGESDEAHWLRDPHAASVWPELALSLYWHSVRFHGETLTYQLGDAIARIPVTDYRRRPLLTLVLGQAHDEKVVKWAIAELEDEGKRRASAEKPVEYRHSLTESPDYLPLRVILSAWTSGPEHQSRLTRIFCQGGARRHLLISVLGSHGGILYEDFLARIAATPSLKKEERDLLAGAIIQYKARSASEEGEMLHWQLAADTLTLTSGRRPHEKDAAKPIVCPA